MKARLTPSIRRQLLYWLLAPIVILWLIGAMVTYGLAIAFATDAYDQALLDSIHSIATRTVFRDSNVVVDLPPVARDILTDNLRDELYYQVTTDSGKLIAGDGLDPTSFGAREEDSIYVPDFHYAKVREQQVRVANVYYAVPNSGGKNVYIMVAQTLHGREKLADDILIGVVLPQLLIVFLSGAVVLFGVRRGLAPLTTLRDNVSNRTPLDLMPIPEDGVPKEVRPLVQAINGFMERLSADMESQRRFIANAAHQLRTPIAGVKTQSELAMRQQDPADVRHALNLIRLGSERAAKLTNQLLTLAKSEPSIVDSSKFETVDLNAITSNTVKELASLAAELDVDLGIDVSRQPVWIKGDPLALHEMFVNIIENAIRYTQSGGRATARVTGSPTELATVTVEDNGPGIPDEERERVFERFYRLQDSLDRSRVSGSGLGLAIVRDIARAHHATVLVGPGENGVGTAVTVEFETVAAPAPTRELAGVV